MELLGFDATRLSSIDEDALETSIGESLLTSPIQSPSGRSRLLSTHSTAAPPKPDRKTIYQHTLTMFELEQLLLAFDALEKFQLAWEEHEMYGSPSTDLSLPMVP
jgi:hypothetical protein